MVLHPTLHKIGFFWNALSLVW